MKAPSASGSALPQPEPSSTTPFPPDLSDVTSRRVASIISKSRRKSRDTLMYLVMDELYHLRPGLSYTELMGLYADVLGKLNDPFGEGLH
jgi:hypothetical protein